MGPFRPDRSQHPHEESPRRGVMLVLMVFSIFLFLVTAAFSVDVAYMQLIRTEQRAATDAAAKAGAAALSREQNVAPAMQAALDVALANQVGGRPLVLDPSDILFGHADLQPDGSWQFQTGTPFTAVRVTARMTDSRTTGAVPLFFGSLFGINTFEPERISTAAYFDQEVCLVIDRSHSMCFDLSGISWSYPPGTPTDPHEIAYPPQPGCRWVALEESIDLFLNIVGGVTPSPRVALVTWGSDIDEFTYEYSVSGRTTPVVQFDVPLAGSSFSDISVAIHSLGDDVMHGGTNMAAGMNAGMQVLNGPDVRPTAQRTIVLMSDGQWNQGDNPMQAANDARKDGIIIHTISFLDAADDSTLRNIATRTGGRSYHASDADGLRAVFSEIARILPATLTD